MKQVIRRAAALVVGLGFGAIALAGLETVTHISDLNASWPLGSDLASTSDDHIRNIKTALKTDFPNINAAVNATPTQLNQLTSNTFTSAVIGSSFIPSSSTVPTNGLYLPAANTLGWSTNTIARGSVNSVGNWTINAPSSGSSLAITGLSGAQAITIGVSSGATSTLSAGWNVGISSNQWNVFSQSTDPLTVGTAGAAGLAFATNATQRMTITSAGVISGYGPTAAALVDMTPDTGTFTGTFTGMTSTVTSTETWTRVGKLVTLNIAGATGTSNATTFTMTGLPSAIQPASIATRIQLDPYGVTDNGGNPTSSNPEVSIAAGSGTLTFLKGGLSTGWTSSGTKGISVGTSITFSYLLN